MNVRDLHFGSDYPEICEWWRARKFPAPARSRLPEHGLVAEKDGVKFAAVWVYLNKGMAHLEWLVTNPQAPLRGRKESIEKLLETIRLEAPRHGVEAVFASLENKNLIELYQQHGFQVTDTQMTNLILRVG